VQQHFQKKVIVTTQLLAFYQLWKPCRLVVAAFQGHVEDLSHICNSISTRCVNLAAHLRQHFHNTWKTLDIPWPPANNPSQETGNPGFIPGKNQYLLGYIFFKKNVPDTLANLQGRPRLKRGLPF
jgi:hypothetical protein